MAFSFTEEPTKGGLSARSPILYEVTETTATPDYKYLIDVYVHSTPTIGTALYRLVCTPDENNKGRFDVSKLVKSELYPNYDINTAPLNGIKNITTGARHLTIKGGFIDDSGTVFADQATSTLVDPLVTQGYLDWDEASNNGWYETGQVITDMPQQTVADISIPENGIYFYPIARDIIDSAFYLADDGTTGSISLGSTSTAATSRIKYIPIGTSQLTLPSATEWYVVTFVDTALNAYSYKFNVTCELKHDVYTVMFVNKYGVFDYLYFYKKSSESISTTSNEYKRINPSQRTQPQKRQFSKNGVEKIQMNTGFVPEAMNEVYKQMMLSEHIQIVAKNGDVVAIPVKVTEEELEFKTGVNDGVINYTFNFEYAYDAINKVW